MPRSWTRPDRRLRGALAALTLALAVLVAPSAVASTSAGGAPAATTAPAPVRAATPYRDALVRELNRVRARHRLPSVRFDERLAGGATAHSRDMVRKRYFAHGPWSTRVQAAAGSAERVGEVLGWLRPGAPAAEAAWLVRQWLRSPPHRAVVLDRGFGRVGIGRVKGTNADGSVTAVYTADFASVG